MEEYDWLHEHVHKGQFLFSLRYYKAGAYDNSTIYNKGPAAIT